MELSRWYDYLETSSTEKKTICHSDYGKKTNVMNNISKSNNSIEPRCVPAHATFAERALGFFNRLQIPENLPQDVEVVYPYGHTDVSCVMDEFYHKYFDDNTQRVFVLGINPGRFGSGMTGVPFTDSVALETQCGISNPFEKRREISSEFVYKCIDAYGGPKKFYSNFFLSAISPVGFVRHGKNYNYYDDSCLYQVLNPYIIQTLKEQLSFGATKTVILFGTGKNQKIFTELNTKYTFFDTVLVLEHPRYIMQYKRKQVDSYIEKYIEVFSQALRSATR